tara:strand:- start:79 stop:699 length:621 start_codon:yes stop_codon:yes gene_type:complete
MILEGLWNQFSKKQFDYLGNIVYRSKAKAICDVGAFAGSVSRAIWKAIEISDKELYMLDNYAFLPEGLRESFFTAVKKTVGNNDRIHTILESSHTYDWTQHDFIIFSPADYNHFKPDFAKLIKSNVKWVALDLSLNCFQRASAMLNAIKNKELTPRYYIDGMIICGEATPCSLPTSSGEFLGHKIQWADKPRGAYVDAVENIVKNF